MGEIYSVGSVGDAGRVSPPSETEPRGDDASSSLDDLSDRNSPSSVMEIDSANWQGPDLRAGAHFFPDGKTRAY